MFTAMSLLAAADPMSHVLPHKIFKIGGFEITNQMFMAVMAAILLFIIMLVASLRVAKKGDNIESYVTKGRLSQFFEVICSFLREEVARPALGKATDKYIYFVWSLFFFILFSNLLGLFPLGSIMAIAYGLTGGEDEYQMTKLAHWSATATGNFWLVAGLSLCSFVMIHVCGIRESGFKHWFMHFLPGPWYLWFLMLPLEIIGALVKPFALTIRLFANMVAGHLIIAALLAMIPVFQWISLPAVIPGALAINCLEVFVALLQAYIFTFLTVLFMSAFLHHDEEHDHDEAHGEEELEGGPLALGEDV